MMPVMNQTLKLIGMANTSVDMKWNISLEGYQINECWL